MDASLIASIITGVSSALFTAFVTKSNSDKKHSIENITQERKKWRDEMREATLAVRCLSEHCCNQGLNEISFRSYGEARAFFATRLNPEDVKDKKILEILEKMSRIHKTKKQNSCIHCNLEGFYDIYKDDDSNCYCLCCQFENAMSRLLKHDWERAKKEVNKSTQLSFLFFLGIFLLYIFWFMHIDFHKIDLNMNSIFKIVVLFFVVYALYEISNVAKSWFVKNVARCEFLCKIFNIPIRK